MLIVIILNYINLILFLAEYRKKNPSLAELYGFKMMTGMSNENQILVFLKHIGDFGESEHLITESNEFLNP